MTTKEAGAVVASVVVLGVIAATVLLAVAWTFGALQLSWPFTTTNPLPLIVAYSIIVIGWVAVARQWGRRSGWHQLAQRYPGAEPRTGQRIGLYQPSFRLRYRTLLLKAGDSHAHFQLRALFGHAPLSVATGHLPFSVPWADISARSEPDWLVKDRVTFEFVGVPEVPFKVRGADAQRIIDASRGRIHLAGEATDSAVRARA